MFTNHKMSLLFFCLASSPLAAMELGDSAYTGGADQAAQTPNSGPTTIDQKPAPNNFYATVPAKDSHLAFWGAVSASAIVLGGGAAWLWGRRAMDRFNLDPAQRNAIVAWMAEKDRSVAGAFQSHYCEDVCGDMRSLATIVAATLDKDPTQTLLVDLTREDLIRAILVLDSKCAALGKDPIDVEKLFDRLKNLKPEAQIAVLSEAEPKISRIAIDFEQQAPMSPEEKEELSRTINTIFGWRHLCGIALFNFEKDGLQDPERRWRKDRGLLQDMFESAIRTKKPDKKKNLLGRVQQQLFCVSTHGNPADWEEKLREERADLPSFNNIGAQCKELLSELAKTTAREEESSRMLAEDGAQS